MQGFFSTCWFLFFSFKPTTSEIHFLEEKTWLRGLSLFIWVGGENHHHFLPHVVVSAFGQAPILYLVLDSIIPVLSLLPMKLSFWSLRMRTHNFWVLMIWLKNYNYCHPTVVTKLWSAPIFKTEFPVLQANQLVHSVLPVTCHSPSFVWCRPPLVHPSYL